MSAIEDLARELAKEMAREILREKLSDIYNMIIKEAEEEAAKTETELDDMFVAALKKKKRKYIRKITRKI
jgi:hypothetical protein